jgi:hypothetical protein
MNLSQQSPPSRPASATPVAVLIVFLLMASVIAFLRGPRAAVGLTGVAMAAASLRLLLVARVRGAGDGRRVRPARPGLLLAGGLLVLAGSLSWPEMSGLVAGEVSGARAAAADRPVVAPIVPAGARPTMPAAATPATTTSAIPTERPAILRPDRLRASDTAKPALDASGERVSYGVANLVDDDPTTAWRVAGDGVGTTIRAEWDEPVALTSIGVVPGYAKVDAADHADRFHQERRVVAVRCSFDHDPPVTVTFADLAELQTFTVDVRTRRVTIEITRTTATPERDFTAISELAFVGHPA